MIIIFTVILFELCNLKYVYLGIKLLNNCYLRLLKVNKKIKIINTIIIKIFDKSIKMC